MPDPPVEYTDAVDSLKAFRKTILETLVAGRVKAGLDAGHESMQKFKGVIDGLSVTPYLFGKMKEKALALKLGGRDVGTGEIYQIKADYVLGTVPYPLHAPYNVARRNLPQVDVFKYEMETNLELLSKTDMSTLHSFVMFQCDSGTFEETPDAENAVYDYYMFYPIARDRSEWVLTDVYIGNMNVNRLMGEVIYLHRRLTKKGTTTPYVYTVSFWFDANLYHAEGLGYSPAVSCQCETEAGAPTGFYSIAGQRINVGDERFFRTSREENTLTGLIKVCGTVTLDGDLIKVWTGHYNVTIEVNEPTWGYTDPPVGVYLKNATEVYVYQAFPHSGYVFDYWTLDGVKISGDSYLVLQIIKESTLRAVFKAA